MRNKLLLMMLCSSILLGGCGKAAVPGSDPNAAGDAPANMVSAQAVVPQVTVPDEVVIPKDSYDKAAYFADYLASHNSGNILASPISLEIALGLTAQGADGETLKELQRYLGKENYADWAKAYMEFATDLESKKKNGYSFSYDLANSIWLQKGVTLNADFKKTAQDQFDAGVSELDLQGNSGKSAGKINEWIEKKTNNMIKNVVSPADLTLTKALLVNALYFESPWLEEWGLTQHDFTTASGEKSEREMLIDSNLTEYFENDFCTAFAKDYYNGFKFVGILPKADGEFRISDLNLKSLMESKTTEFEVHAIAPKLDYETCANDLVAMLVQEGVQKPFLQQADFTKMSSSNDLYISKIIQKCKITMDENGTQAAAATVVAMEDECALLATVEEKEVKEVNLDRPFAFLIYDSQNDEIVFVGKVTE